MSKIAPAVKKETAHIAIGTAVGVGIMLVVFAVLHRFDAGVLVSALIGGALAVTNFFMLGLTVQKISDGQSEDRARKWMQFSYNMRMLVMVVWLIVAITVPFLNWVAAAVPMLMPRLTIGVMQITGMYKKKKPEDPELGETQE